MYSPITIEELLEAKEGERFQFKEAKNRFDANEAARCCCALANCGGGKLVFGVRGRHRRAILRFRSGLGGAASRTGLTRLRVSGSKRNHRHGS